MKTIRHTTHLLAAAVATATWLVTPLLAQNVRNDREAEAALQAAINREVIDGNLQDAIAQYTKLIETHANSRAVAAKALYHLGQAHEKLGNAEARKAYERIAREFADQKEVAADAGRRLAALGGAPISNGLEPRPVAFPQTWTDVTVSLDGRWLAALSRSDSKNGDTQLVVKEIATGETRPLVAGSESGVRTRTYPEEPVLSPDGRHVAYAWSDNAEGKGRWQLRVIANETGAAPSILMRSRENSVVPYAWAPDAKSILASIPNRDGMEQLGWVSVADGSLKIIKALERPRPREPQGTSLSPDGRYIAYAAFATNPSKALQAVPNSTDVHIYVLAADGSSEVAVVKTAGINKSPVWTPDGAHIIFTSNLSGKNDLWSVPVRDGEAVGSAALLKQNVGAIQTVTMTRTGTLYYRDSGKPAGVEQVFIAELIPGGTSRTVENFVGLSPAWSPDGKSIAFKRHRLQSESYWYYTVIRSVETGHETTVSRAFFRGDPPRWLSNGESVLTIEGTLSESDGGDQWWNIVNLQRNSLKRVLQVGARHHFAHLSPDDRTLYSAAHDPNDRSGRYDRIVAVDLGAGHEREVFRLPGTVETFPRGVGIGMTLSPDGRSLALAAVNSKTGEAYLTRVDVDGSNYRELFGPYQVHRRSTFDKLKWTKDGHSILFAKAAPDKGAQIMRIGSEGGTPEFTGLTIDERWTFDVSPDGSRVAYHTAPSKSESALALFAIDNLPALLKGAK